MVELVSIHQLPTLIPIRADLARDHLHQHAENQLHNISKKEISMRFFIHENHTGYAKIPWESLFPQTFH